ncbi:MAG: exosome complex exonuclease Rrp41 [Candidatus Micrarchaeia archaeon]
MEKPKLIVDGKRLDGRAPDELRPLRIEAGVLNKAEGSCYIEWGTNKVLAAVYGPKECVPRHEMNPYRAVVRCRYMMSPFASLEEHGRSGPNRRSTELSKVIREVFENVILTEQFPKTEINIFIEVLQADGGTRCAGITAASVALANAGIPMKDMVAAVAAGKIDGQIVVDCDKMEDNYGEADVPMAIAARNNEVLLLQMDGELTKEELKAAIDIGMAAAKHINSLQVAALKRVYTRE